MKLLTPEDFDPTVSGGSSGMFIARALATVKALAERLAMVESCPACGGRSRAYMTNAPADEHPLPCRPCGETGRCHKDWQAALASIQLDWEQDQKRSALELLAPGRVDTEIQEAIRERDEARAEVVRLEGEIFSLITAYEAKEKQTCTTQK